MTDAELIRDQDRWPRWPVLPLKRIRNGGLECGYLIGDMTGERLQNPVVYSGSIFDIKEEHRVKVQYSSIEIMLDDGWKVD